MATIQYKIYSAQAQRNILNCYKEKDEKIVVRNQESEKESLNRLAALQRNE